MSEDKSVPPPQEPAPPQQATPAKPQFEEGRDPVHVPPKPYSMPPKRKLPLFEEKVVFEERPEPSLMDVFLKVVGILIIGIFVLGGLVFATCFLSMRR